MRRTAVILATLVAVAWQSFAAMAATVVSGKRADVAHSVMHWQEIPHHHGHLHAAAGHEHGGATHHHDDGTHDHPHDAAPHPHDHGDGAPAHSHDEAPAGIHVDDSDESQAHLAAGHCCAPALVSAILTPPPVPSGIAPGALPPRPEPPPLPGGLFRPPRSLA